MNVCALPTCLFLYLLSFVSVSDWASVQHCCRSFADLMTVFKKQKVRNLFLRQYQHNIIKAHQHSRSFQFMIIKDQIYSFPRGIYPQSLSRWSFDFSTCCHREKGIHLQPFSGFNYPRTFAQTNVFTMRLRAREYQEYRENLPKNSQHDMIFLCRITNDQLTVICPLPRLDPYLTNNVVSGVDSGKLVTVSLGPKSSGFLAF
jgi:hypothetical protein